MKWWWHLTNDPFPLIIPRKIETPAYKMKSKMFFSFTPGPPQRNMNEFPQTNHSIITHQHDKTNNEDRIPKLYR